jgi:hypothetical protein
LRPGIGIVNAKKSIYYKAALSHFARARDCYRAAGLAAKWEQTVRRVCALHNRKTGFIDGFQAFVARAKRSEPPSFLERAKTRWREQDGREVLWRSRDGPTRSHRMRLAWNEPKTQL